jgi:hypothetical protein
MKPPCLGAVNSRSASETRSIVVVINLVRLNDSRPAVGIDKDTRVTKYVWTSVVTIYSEPLITQMVSTYVTKAQRSASFKQQYVFAGLGQNASDNTASRACPDNDGVVFVHEVSKPVINHETRSRLPPCCGSL